MSYRPETLILKKLDRLACTRERIEFLRHALEDAMAELYPESVKEIRILEKEAAEIDAAIRQLTLACAHTITGQSLTASYVRSGYNWDSPALVRMAADNPKIWECATPRAATVRIVPHKEKRL